MNAIDWTELLHRCINEDAREALSITPVQGTPRAADFKIKMKDKVFCVCVSDVPQN